MSRPFVAVWVETKFRLYMRLFASIAALRRCGLK